MHSTTKAPPASGKLLSISLAAVFAWASLVVHFTATALYLLPPNLAKQALAETLARYMTPLFIQKWHFFSPNPGISSIKLSVRCQHTTGAWTPWHDPMEHVLERLYHNRISGNGKLMYVYRGVGVALSRDLRSAISDCHECAREEVIDVVEHLPSHALASRFARSVCDDIQPKSSRYQFKIMEFFPVQYSQRHDLSRRWGRVTEFDFPARSLRQTRPDR